MKSFLIKPACTRLSQFPVQTRRYEPIIIFLTFILLSALIFASCAPASDHSDGASAAPETTFSPSPEPVPASGGRLALPMPENISVNNPEYSPLLVFTEETLQLYSLVYDPLIAVDDSNMLTPSLAQSWTRDTNIENTWLITLRKEVRWHDGSELTADDVLYTYETLRTFGQESYYASALNSIARIEKLDGLTLRFYMNDSGMMSLYALNFPVIRAGSERLVGTGAYRVEQISDDMIRLRVNTDWWDRPPYIDTIDFLARPNNDTALSSYSAGQLNFVPSAQLAVGKYSEQGVTTVKDVMTQNMEVLLINHRRSKMNSKELRHAIAHAINRSRIITNIYMNRARSCDVPVPPDSWLYDNNSTQFDYNVQTAASLLDSIGYQADSEGQRKLSLTLLTSSTTENTTRADAAQLIAAQLGHLGINVEIITASHSFGDAESEFLAALEAGEWDIALVGFNLNQSNDLTPYFDRYGKNNYGNYPGGNIMTALAGMRSAVNEGDLRNYAYELQKTFTEELPFIVLYFRLNSVVYSSSLKGVDIMREPMLMRNLKNWYLRVS